MLGWPIEAVEAIERSNEVGALANLWDAELMRGEAVDRDRVTEVFLEHSNDRILRYTSAVLEDIWNVLQDEAAWALFLKNLENSEEKLPLKSVLETELLASLGERLAGETRGENIVIRDRCGDDVGSRQLTDVAPRFDSEVVFVQSVEGWLPLRCKHSLAAQFAERYVESTEAGEEVDETER